MSRNGWIILAVVVLAGGVWFALGALGARWDDPADYARPEQFRTVEQGVLYRAAQPTLKDLKEIYAETGFKTILCLRGGYHNPLLNMWYRNEKAFAAEHGIEFVHIPAHAQKRTDNNRLAIETFFRLIDDPNKRPLLVHCQQGQNRTGVICYLYRTRRQGWSHERALGELLAMGGKESDLRVMGEQAKLVGDPPAKPVPGPFERISVWARGRMGRLWYGLSLLAGAVGLLRLMGCVAYIVPDHRRKNAMLWTAVAIAPAAVSATTSLFVDHHAETALWLLFLIARALYYQMHRLGGLAGVHAGLALVFVGSGNGLAIVVGLAIGLGLGLEGPHRARYLATVLVTMSSLLIFLTVGDLLPAVTLDAPGIYERSAQNQSLYGILLYQVWLHRPTMVVVEDTLRPQAWIPIAAAVVVGMAGVAGLLLRVGGVERIQPDSARVPARIAYVGWWVLAGVMLGKCAWPGTYVLAAPAIFGTLCCLPVKPLHRVPAAARWVVLSWMAMVASSAAVCIKADWLGGIGLQWIGTALFLAASIWALRGERLHAMVGTEDRPGVAEGVGTVHADG